MRRLSTILAIAVLCVASTASWAQLAPYCQGFEGLDATSPTALGDDGWLVFGNVFDAGGGYQYGYGVFPAPNSTAEGVPDAFCGIASGEGDYEQGDQQFNVFNDYANADHMNNPTWRIESNVFQEQGIDLVDIGSTWVFEFDFRGGNVEGASTTAAFIKTLQPPSFATTNFITADTTAASNMWSTSSLSIYIDPSLAGQILQFGFVSTASNYEGSGLFYDNVNFVDLVDACDDECDDSDDEDGDSRDFLNFRSAFDDVLDDDVRQRSDPRLR